MGLEVGLVVGAGVGLAVGTAVGSSVGLAVGLTVVGLNVGLGVGAEVGQRMTLWRSAGSAKMADVQHWQPSPRLQYSGGHLGVVCLFSGVSRKAY